MKRPKFTNPKLKGPFRNKRKAMYNVLFPIWLLIIWPPVVPFVILFNILFDAFVLMLTLKRLEIEKDERWALLKSRLWKVVVAGFLADIAGGAFMLLALLIDGAFSNLGMPQVWFYEQVVAPLMFNPLSSFLGFAWTLAAVALAGFLIYVLNKNWCLKGCGLSDDQVHKTALALAVFTAPYVFFVPSQLMWTTTY